MSKSWSEWRERRKFKELLERSSLGHDQLWIECPEHGTQPTDPYQGGCILCVEYR